jgi:hypothetical protein
MIDKFRRPVTFLLRFFPPTLILTMFVCFGYYALHYKWLMDDFTFRETLKEMGIVDASLMFYKNFNGRLASHFYLLIVFKLFTNHVELLFIYRTLLLFAFIISLAHFLKNYLETIRRKIIPLSQLLFFSAFITAFLFFFFFAGRLELWFWISSTGVYLISFIIGMNAFALVLAKKQNTLNFILSILLFFLAGGFSESYAVMYIALLLYLDFKIIRKDVQLSTHKATVNFALLGIIAGILINLFSGGVHNRLGELPHFGFFYALKNTAHSIAFSFLRWKYFLLEALLIITFLFYAHFLFPKPNAGLKYFLKRSFLVIIFISVSFFIPCYLLSDIVPDRAAAIGYFAGVLFLFDYFIFRSDTFGKINYPESSAANKIIDAENPS